MLRIRAVKTLLIEEVAGLAHGRPGTDRPAAEEVGDAERELLDRAARRAAVLIAVSWVAIGILFLFHPATDTLLSFHGDETIFTVGILVVAVHSGFRLGQWEKYRSVARVYDELSEREPG